MKILLFFLALTATVSSVHSQTKQRWDPFLDTLQTRTLQWFLDTTPASTGLAPDRWPAVWSPSSIAAVGFALTSYPISAERKLVTRNEAASRVLTTLRFLLHIPQNDRPAGAGGYKGLYYHFINAKTGEREWKHRHHQR